MAMRPLILKCPSCNGDLAVSKLHCHACDIAVEGDFAIPALLRLNRAQLDFVEVFLKNRGIIREVERELGVSYPTVRARLDDVIAALGYSAKSAPETSTADEGGSRRRSVLADLKGGKLTPEEALAALNEPRTKD